MHQRKKKKKRNQRHKHFALNSRWSGVKNKKMEKEKGCPYFLPNTARSYCIYRLKRQEIAYKTTVHIYWKILVPMRKMQPRDFHFLMFQRAMEFWSYPQLDALAVCPFSRFRQIVLLPFPTVDSACARLLTWWPSLCVTTLLSKMRSMRITCRKCWAVEVPLNKVKSWVCRNDISTLATWNGAICQDPGTLL